MKRFDLYSHPKLGFVAVKDGFSWPGFFFTAIWMLICRMWVGAIVVVAIYAVGSFAADVIAVTLGTDNINTMTFDEAEMIWFISEALSALVGLVICVTVGINGNRWRRNVLARRGFQHEKSMQAASAGTAMAKAIAEQKAAEAESA